MASWDALRDYCANKHPALDVRLREHRGKQWVQLDAALGPIANFDRYVILLHNFDLAVGQVIELGEQLVLRQSLPIENASDEALRLAVDEVAAQALKSRDAYERKPEAAP